MPSYHTVTSNGLFLFNSFEERGVQRFGFQNYFKANQVAECENYVQLLESSIK